MSQVLVTGGCGFLGAAFVNSLLESDSHIRVVNFDLLTYAARPERLSGCERDPRYTFVRGDIADPDQVAALFANHGPFEVLFNFAAETHVDRSLRDNMPFVRTNVVGTQVLLDAVRSAGGKFLQISTDEVYGPLADGVFRREDAPLLPANPYAATKAAADHLVQTAARSYDLDTQIIRSVNVYGPDQYPEKFIPLAVTTLLQGGQVPLYGDGRQVRDWLYVEDYARAVMTVHTEGARGETYHAAAGAERPNREIAEAICSLLGVPTDDGIRHVADRPGHDRRYGLDAGRLHNLGWKPEVDFALGLRRTVEWFRAHPCKPAPAAGSV